MNQGIDELISFQAMNIVEMIAILTCRLFAHEIWQR